jgi:hypothetical protein
MAMTTSTVSRLSRPRSLAKWAVALICKGGLDVCCSMREISHIKFGTYVGSVVDLERNRVSKGSQRNEKKKQWHSPKIPAAAQIEHRDLFAPRSPSSPPPPFRVSHSAILPLRSCFSTKCIPWPCAECRFPFLSSFASI